MTGKVETERPNIIRALVEGVDRHGVRVADEFQAFSYATARKGLKVKAGDVVELARSGNRFEIQRVLPYQLAEEVEHTRVPGLYGVPIAGIGHPYMFSVRGITYLREEQQQQAHTQVQSWVFKDPDAEAKYLMDLLRGGQELPGVHLSTALIQRLSSLGIDTRSLERVTSERQTVEQLRQRLSEEAVSAGKLQESLQSEIVSLFNRRDEAQASWEDYARKADAASSNLEALLLGIEDAEKEKEQLIEDQHKQLAEAEQQRQDIISDAQAQAESIRQAANKDKADTEAKAEKVRADAEKIKDEAKAERTKAIQDAHALAEKAKQLQSLLGAQEEYHSKRKELTQRKAYTEIDEVAALQAALKNLSDARGTTAHQLVALHVGLKHTPFTVLSGPSGSGKTSLILAYARQMGIHVTTIAVQPGWTSVQDLHGYVNPLRSAEYRSTPFFEALGYQVRQNKAAELREVLHGLALEGLSDEPDAIPLDLVLLDEINLSHVEYFLADYLSAFELDSRNVALTTPDEALRLALSEDGTTDDAHPLAWLRHFRGQLDVPRSFLIAGTANEDDTTRGFSDKFRDRSAFLHVEAPKLVNKILQRPKEVKDGRRYVPRTTWEAWLEDSSKAAMNERLIKFSEALHEAKLPVSVRLFQRTARMSGDAERLLKALDVPDASNVALDLAVSLGIAHKYAQLTEGHGLEAKKKRQDLKEALMNLLAGRQEATAVSLNWNLEG